MASSTLWEAGTSPLGPTPLPANTNIADSSSIAAVRGRKCRYCTRAFAKTEHLKRHERSHTGERPYVCSICGKEYARSDVLTRHLKRHSLPSSATNPGVQNWSAAEPVTNTAASPGSSKRRRVSVVQPRDPMGPGDDQGLPPRHRSAGLALDSWLPLERTESSCSQQSGQGRPLASMESRRATLGSETALPTSSIGHLQDMSLPSGIPVSVEATGEQAVLYRDHVPNDLSDRRNSILSPAGSLQDWMDGLIAGDAALLQSWMNEPVEFPSRLPNLEFPLLNPPSPHAGCTNNDGSISNEVLTKVQQQWPMRVSDASKPRSSLWHALWRCEARNLITDSATDPLAVPILVSSNTKWRLHHDTRQRMDIYINSPAQSASDPEFWTSGVALPSIDVLDIGLQLFFRHFHVLLPFVHTPTFCPNTAPTAILLSMCLIGFHILNTRGTNPLLSQLMSIVLNKTCQSVSRSVQLQPLLSINHLANAFLVLSLGAMTGEYAVRAEYRQLHEDTIIAAQRLRLFCSQSAYDREMRSSHSISEQSKKWEAWARVESAKRVIVCLFMTDSWFADVFQVTPSIQTNYCQILLPCSDAIFQCASSPQWSRMIETQRGESAAITSNPGGFTIQTSQTGTVFGPMATDAILSAIRLRLADSYHSIMSGIDGTDNTGLRDLTPWQWYESESSARNIGTLVLSIASMPSMANMDANNLVKWHHICIGLTTDLPMFDRAAGQCGPELAHKASMRISEWSKTNAARRACVHAAQAFRAMTQRRVSEGVMFHSVPGLFHCALVLGLYIFSRAQESSGQDIEETQTVYDLLSPVNWPVVGTEGFYADGSSGNGHADPTICFIRGETEMQFGNVTQAQTFQSAKLILLEFAGLLDDIATRWKIGDYANVLRILSDTILEG